MATTVRLLSTYPNPAGGYYSPNTIVTLDDDVATALLAGGIGASSDLTGGTVPPITATPFEASRANSALGPRGNRMAMIGDSLTAFQGAGPSGTVSIAGRTASFTVNSPSSTTGHGVIQGQQFVMQLASPQEPAINGVFTVARVVDQNTFEFEIARAPVTAGPWTAQTVLGRAATSRHWALWANKFMGYPYEIVLNAGIGSNTSSDVLARWEADLTPAAPDVVVLMIGTNDIRDQINNGAAAMEAARERAFVNIKAIVEGMLNRGWLPVLCTVTPVATAQSQFALVTQNILLLNEKIRNYGLSRKSVVLVDAHRALVDPAAADGRALASAMADDVHYKTQAAYLIGQEFANTMRKFAPVPKPMIASNADVGADRENRLSNPMMTGTAGTPGTNGSGTFATEWQGRASAATAGNVGSVVPRTVADDGEARGNKQRCVITFANSGETATLTTTSTINSFKAGDEVYADWMMKVSGATNVSYILCTLNVTIAGVSYPMYIDSGSSSGWVNGETIGPVPMRTLSFRLPANASNAVLSIQVGASGAGGCTLEVSLPRIARKTYA